MNIAQLIVAAWNSPTVDQYARKQSFSPMLFTDEGNAKWDESAHPRVAKGSTEGHGGQFTSKSNATGSAGITVPAKPTNEEAKPGDQMGLFGEADRAKKPAFQPMIGGKPKQQALFDSKGDKDQMLMFDDAVTPADRLLTPEAPKPDNTAAVRVAKLADVYENQARKGEGGSGLAVGAEFINDRWKADAMRGMLRDVQGGMSIHEAESKWKEQARKWIAAHNARRPKDVNWARFEGAADSALETASRMLRQGDPKDGDVNADGLVFKDGRWHRKEESTGPIPLRERAAFANNLAKQGKSQQEIEDAMRARSIAISDAKRHAARAFAEHGSKPPAESPKAEEVSPVEKPTPKPLPTIELPVPELPQEKASAALEEAEASGKNPRQAAAVAQKKLDEDYEFARASDVRNAGEDLKGSARHKVNAWKGLAEAEKDGTAAEMVTRDQLLKLEPHNLFVHADKNPLTALAMHYVLRAFPPMPGTGKRGNFEKDRKQYLEAYQSIKAKAEELAKTKDSADVVPAIKEMQSHVTDLIRKLRGQTSSGSMGLASATDKYNQTANDLVNLSNSLGVVGRVGSNSVAGKTLEFSKAVKERYGDLSVDNIAEHAKDIMEGKSFNKTFGKESKKTRRFDPSEAYVKVAKRSGGRELSSVTSDPNKATKHMVEAMGLRGVQWGNSVTDEERKHHAAKAVEALTDLADVTGLHPKDIALDGKLGLAIGARGKGNASAHYEPSTQVINLTRASGVGALAHEWGHAFDHMLNGYGSVSKVKGAARGDLSSKTMGNYMSGDLDTHEIRATQVFPGHKQWTSTTSDPSRYEGQKSYTVHERPLSEIRTAYREWNKASKPYRERLRGVLDEAVKSGSMSAAKANDYWGSDHEIFARTFERHVQHKLETDGRENTYLSGLGGNHPLWPTKEEAAEMSDAFDGIMSAYRKHKHGSAEKVKFSAGEAADAFMPVVDRYRFKPLILTQ